MDGHKLLSSFEAGSGHLKQIVTNWFVLCAILGSSLYSVSQRPPLSASVVSVAKRFYVRITEIAVEDAEHNTRIR